MRPESDQAVRGVRTYDSFYIDMGGLLLGHVVLVVVLYPQC